MTRQTTDWNQEADPRDDRPPTRIVPRWEWRVFAHALQPLLAVSGVRFGARDDTHSDVYLLSTLSRHSVKARNRVLEVKMLSARSPDGLEQWTPVLSQPFPVAADVLEPVWDAWGIQAPLLERPSYTLETLLSDVVDRHDALHAVTVTKDRTRISLLDCAGEHVSLVINGAHWESMAFEDVHEDVVLGAVRHLGLARAVNTNYPRALKAVLGLRQPASTSFQEQQ